MTSSRTFVIVGAGQAGGKAAEALRERGFDGRLVLIGAETDRPYERPPLSKDYLNGNAGRDSVFLHEAAWYDEHDVEVRFGRTATALDRTGRQVTLDDGTTIEYDKVLLATGSRPRAVELPGADSDGVLYLRTLTDSETLRATLGRVNRLAIIGAGWIGLEAAAAARSAGVAVTVVESAELPLLRVLGPELAQVFADLHRAHDVDFRFGATVEAITADDGQVTGLRLGGGELIAADAVLVAIGATPNVELAAAAGLTVDDGVLVDATLQTSDADIVAAGDIARATHPFYGTRIRVEHWANALNQPDVAAATMLGQPAEYDELPYFFTDQYDLGMEYIGWVESGGYDEVVFRGDVTKREFIAFWLKDGRVRAGMNVNVWDVVEDVKALIRSEQVVDRARLADERVPLGHLL